MYTTLEHFLKYVKYDTQSDEKAGLAGKTPSTDTQWELAREMERELNERGFENVKVSEYCYVTGFLPANTDRKIPAIGFITHMDTAAEASGKNVKARVVKNYDGGNIVLVLLGTTSSYSWDNATVLTGTGGNTASFRATGGATVKYGLSTTFCFTYDDENPSGNILKNNDVIGVMYQAENGDLSKLFYVDADGTKGADIEATYTISGLTDNTWSGSAFTFTTAGTSSAPTYFTAVPEPTSGLLLLLGMAGLALKRKRA